MIAALPPGDDVLDVPEDDWVIEELRRWTGCTGMALPTDLEAQPMLAPNKRRERLATLLRVAATYKVLFASGTLWQQLNDDFVRAYPVAAGIFGVQYNFPEVATLVAKTLTGESLPPEDPVDRKLWDEMPEEKQDSLRQLLMKDERPLDEAAIVGPSLDSSHS